MAMKTGVEKGRVAREESGSAGQMAQIVWAARFAHGLAGLFCVPRLSLLGPLPLANDKP